MKQNTIVLPKAENTTIEKNIKFVVFIDQIFMYLKYLLYPGSIIYKIG